MKVVAPLSPATGNAWKINLFINIAQFGFSDVYYYNNGAGLTPAAAWSDVIQFTKALSSARSSILGFQAAVVGARVSPLGPSPGSLTSAQQSVPLSPSQLQLQVSGQTGPPANPTQCVDWMFFTQPFGLRRLWFMRGYNGSGFIVPSSTPFQTSIGGTILGDAANWFNSIVGNPNAVPSPTPPTSPFRFTGQLCLKGLLRPSTTPVIGSQVQSYPITGISAATAPGFLTYTIATPTVNPFVQGVRLVARGVRLTGQKSGNGAALIVSSTSATGTTTLVTSKPWKYSAQPSIKVNGVIYVQTYALYPILAYNILKVGSRNTGGPFFRTRGRGKTQTV
jgi:hypothetical protein